MLLKRTFLLKTREFKLCYNMNFGLSLMVHQCFFVAIGVVLNIIVAVLSLKSKNRKQLGNYSYCILMLALSDITFSVVGSLFAHVFVTVVHTSTVVIVPGIIKYAENAQASLISKSLALTSFNFMTFSVLPMLYYRHAIFGNTISKEPSKIFLATIYSMLGVVALVVGFFTYISAVPEHLVSGGALTHLTGVSDLQLNATNLVVSAIYSTSLRGAHVLRSLAEHLLKSVQNLLQTKIL